MNNPQFKNQQKTDRPVLIVDKRGVVGAQIAKKVSSNLIVILVSASYELGLENVIHVPYLRKIPKIPDNYYSHIFLIDDGKSLDKNVSSFVKKANGDLANLILIEGIREKNQKVISEVKSYKNSSIVFYGDLFCKDTILSSIGKILYQAKKNRKIQVEGEGLEILYPTYFDDFVDSLIEAVFVRQTLGKEINIFPKEGTTLLSLSRTIQSIDPLIKIDFIKNKAGGEGVTLQEGSFVLPSDYNVKGRIRKILEEDLPQDFNQNAFVSQIEEKKYLRRIIKFILILTIFLLILPLFTTLAYLGLGLYEIDKMRDTLEKGNITQALSLARTSKTFFNFSQKTLGPLKSETKLIGLERDALAIEARINAGKSLSEASVDLLTALQGIEKITKGEALDPKSEFSKALSLMNNSIFEFRVVQAKLNGTPEIEEKIEDIDPVIDLLSNSINVLPSVLGFEKDMKYLVLFQNNMELRPGGGFIGSFGILDIKNAAVKDFKIYDVYSADGQLKGHIEPPYPIRRYLPQPNFFLRDSNFDLDFTKNASAAANFLDLEMAQKVDGVIAVDVDFIRDLLKALGEVEVIDYKLKVSSDNVFQEINEKSQKDFFPGSTQKKDFLSSLFKAIEQKLDTKDDVSYLTLARKVTELLASKHILLASNENSVQDTFSINNWSSQIRDQRRSEDSVFNDFLGVVEANFGINKVNFNVTRSISKAQIIDEDGRLSSTVSIAYKNDSESENYKNYLRLILPEDATITRISFDNVAQGIITPITDPKIYEAPNFRKPDGLEVEEVYDFDKKIVGFLVEVPKNKIKTISVTYELSQRLSPEPKISYSLKIFKQPGTSDIPFDFSIYFPKDYQVLDKEKGSREVEGNRVNFGTNLKSDSDFNFSFSKK